MLNVYGYQTVHGGIAVMIVTEPKIPVLMECKFKLPSDGC